MPGPGGHRSLRYMVHAGTLSENRMMFSKPSCDERGLEIGVIQDAVQNAADRAPNTEADFTREKIE